VSSLNIWPVLIAAASSFLLGGLWYSPAVFGKVWNREAGHRAESGHPIKALGLSFLCSLAAATAFAFLIGPHPPLSKAVLQGLVMGSCFVAASFGMNYLHADRSVKMWLIDGGYHTAQFMLFGLIVGLWN